MPRIYVLTNHKGGVGKSTTATNITLGLAAVLRQAKAKNSRVSLIDTDSQAHATINSFKYILLYIHANCLRTR